MMDKTAIEQQALEAALCPLGEIATEIGFEKSLSGYTRKEALSLVEAVVDAYQNYLLENQPKGASVYASYA